MRGSSSVGWLRPAVLATVAVMVLGLGPARAAGEPAEQTPDTAATATKLQALSDLLADPDIKALLASRPAGRPQAVEAASPPAPTDNTMALSLAARLQRLRSHLVAVSQAGLAMPEEAGPARLMMSDAVDRRGWWGLAGLFAGFVALGFGTEALFRLAMRPAQRWLLALTLGSVSERVRAVFARLGYGLGLVVFFGLGSVGAFLLFDWPVTLKEILLGYLIAFLSARLATVVGRILLAPGGPRFRVVPMSTKAAYFLFRRWIALAVIVGFASQTVAVLVRFGLSPLAAELWGDLAALLVAAVGLDILWRTPRREPTPQGDRAQSWMVRHHGSLALGGSLVVALLWVLWVAQATQAFSLVAFAAGLPVVVTTARRAVNHVLRPPGVEVSTGEATSIEMMVFERGARSVVIVAAALGLGHILGLDLTTLTMQDTLATRLTRGAISVVIIALVADFVWHLVRALIDRKIAASLAASVGTEEAGHAARLATLLPTVRNILLVLIAAVAGMMALAAAGVDIGPLVASAGVVGVAIGFGAQTLVKDVISGIFYLFDDAFRIGEYIQSGTYKGTVESFSLRSVKLRHQRGALYTVPFGILGAVQNQSRDWVVDKIVLNVPYGTDLDRVRKLIKRIGESLMADEELGPDIINPLKMQGVVEFGDFAIQIQTKMMTKPGDVQFLARRRALLMINQSFRDNGIGFATPVVQVAGDGGLTAAGQKGLELFQAAKPG